MRTYLLALAVVTALAAISSAADEECVQRKLRGLALHWPNPRDCYSFYRCTNKDVKREIACPAGRQYNRRTGRCAPVGRKVCRLSLLAPLQEADNPCSGEISGTYLADPKSCRSFNICNANLAYPQTCNPGSYFDSAKSACVPDTDTTCWENLCLSKANGVYVANENDCYGFYVCADKTAVKQACPSGSYFNKDSLNCVPGVCPSDVVVTTPCPEVTTTTKPAVVTTPCAGQTTTTKVVETTTSCSEKTTTPKVVETTTSCSEKTTTPKVVETTTSCSEKTTTPKVVETTTSCSEKTTTPNVVETTTPKVVETTTSCSEKTTTPKVVETTTPKVVETTTSCSEKTTTPKVVETTTTPKVVETTTPKVVETTTSCSEKTTTPKVVETTTPKAVETTTSCSEKTTTPKVVETTTPKVVETTTSCSEKTTTPQVVETTTPKVVETTTSCSEKTTTPKVVETTTPKVVETTTSCSEKTTTPKVVETTTPKVVETTTSCSEKTTTPKVVETTTSCSENTTTPKVVETTTPKVVETTTSCSEKTTTPKVVETTTPKVVETTTSCSEKTTTPKVVETTTTPKVVETTTPKVVETTTSCSEKTTTPKVVETTTPKAVETTTSCSEKTTTPKVVETTTPKVVETTTPKVVETTTSCSEKTTTPMVVETTTPKAVETTTSCSEKTTTPKVVETTTPKVVETTTPKVVETTTSCSEKTTTPKVVETTTPKVVETTTSCSEKTTTPQVVETTTPKVVETTTSCSEKTTTPKVVETTTPKVVETTTSCSEKTTTPKVVETTTPKVVETTTSCSEKTTTPKVVETTTPKVVETTTSCSEKTTTPKVVETTTPKVVETTTPKVVETTTSCSEKTTTPKVVETTTPKAVETTTSCSEKTTTPKVVETTTPKVVETTTPKAVETTTTCSEKTTTPKVVETTTPKVVETTTSCSENTTTPKVVETTTAKVVETTTPKVVETTTPCIQGDCSANNCDQTSCLNAENHIAFPAKNDKTQYCVCMNKQAICRVCPEGSEFDSQINVCKPIVVTTTPCPPTTPATTTASVVVTTTPCLQGDCSANNCDQTSCLNAENHIAFPAKNDKTQYCVCMNKQAICRVCPEGSEFNGQLNVCMPKELTTACPEAAKHASVKCAGGYEEGDLIMHPKNRQLFYICFDGKFFETSCGEGNYYNAEEKSCMPDYEPKQSRSKRSVMKHEEHICPGGLQNFESVAHPLDCNRKLVCRDGRMIEESCERGYYFNEAVKACIKDVNNICPLSSRAASTTCVDGTLKVNDKDCTAYFRCCTNTWKEANCAEGEYFNPINLQCEKDEKYYCLPPPVVPCVEGKQYQDPANCSAYFLCCSGELVSKSCETGYYFNGKECELDVNNQCWPKEVEPNCVENEQKPGTNCSSYYRCCGNDWVEEFCDENYYYDEKKDKCLADTNNVCWPKVVEPNCVENEQKPGTNCSSYYRCCGNDWVEEFCDENYYYDEKKDKCLADTNNVCWPKVVEPNCVENEQKPGTNCSSYLRCCGNDWVEEFCDENYYYDEKKDKCLADTNNVCWPKVVEPNCVENEQKPGTNCSSYLRCCGNDWVEEFCDENYYYDEKKDKCLADTNNVCWPKVVEPNCVENEQKPGTNCSSYLRCCGNDWVEEFCDENYYYDEKKDKCLADTNNVCWPKVVEPNCVENEQKPGTNCSSYLRCCGNDWVEEFCDENYYYDEKKDKCLADTNNVCWPKVVEPNCVENEQKPGTNCSSYLRCCGNDWVEEFCDENYYYDEKKDKCLADTNNVCWPKVVEPNCVENEQKPGTNCSSYLRCCGNDWVEEFCDENYYYDEKKDKCLADTNNVCWPKVVEPNCVENEQKPGTNCSSYLRCCGNDWVEEFCDENYYYDEKKDKCLADTNNVCWPKVVEPNCVENEQKPGTNCSSYLRCCGNDWVEEFCDENYYYDEKKDKCLADTNNVCWPKVVEPNCVENEQKPGTNCSSYLRCCGNDWVEEFCDENYYYDVMKDKCLADTNNVCWPKEVETCSDGELRPDDDNCAAYYKCCSNGWVAEVCPDNEYFNWETEACEFDAEHECREAAPCKTGEKYADPENCSAYYECCGGVFKPQYCEAGYLYASAEAECVLDTKNECWTDEEDDNGCNTDCPGGYKNGTFVEGDDCDTFYICVNGELQLQSCGYGMYYNNVSRSCVADTDRTCWTNVCADKKNGVYLPVPKHCSMFYECMNGQSNALYCEEGDYFNPDTSACEPDLNAVCYNPCAEVDKVMTLPHPNCNQYYWCNDKTTLVGTCPLGGFNASLGSCDASTSCSNYKCNGVPNYVPFPDEKDKTLYYICINGVAVEKQCLPNQEFNGFACQYVSSPDCNATLCDTLQPYESFPTINGSETEFCMCIKGLAQKESCPTDYVFNDTMKMCASNIPCNSMICKTNDNYYTFANNDDPATFCICINNVAVVADCPAKQTYNPYLDACTELVYSSDCDQTVCLKEDDSYTYAPKNESLNGICECKSNVGIFVECPPDTVFDSFLNICKLIDINCQSSKCVGAEDNTVFPALTTDEGYCQCQKGVAVYQNCLASESFNDTVLKCVPSLCDRSKCADQPPNVGYPATDNKYGFCMCDESGSSTFRPCPNDTEFSSVTNACKVPLQNCADTECVGVADNTKVPALSTVHGYCLCQGGKPTFEECLNNWVFDSVSQICEAPKVAIEDVCDMNYCNLPGNALKKYPSYSNIYGFCQCSADGPTFEFCQAGYIFNEYSLVCVPSAESMCDIALCADATPESPYGIPAKTSNTAFCLCSGPDSIMVLNCADGKFFDKTLGYCVSKLEQGCGCPDGMKTGDRAPNAEDCTQYYECQSGSMQLKSCPAGQYFNTNTNCCLNNDGTCDANTACTCLGLYREGERIIHPHNMQLYYVCEKNNLHERNCGSGRIFNKAINQCMQATQAATFSKHFMRKRSADIEEFPCLANEKRSVPSNCSQYELCINETWQRQTCPNSYYYNPEQQKCLEPRDDTVCEYAKASNLPPCNAKNEQRLHRGRTCQQYFRCQNSKWHLNNCGKALYYDEAYGTCLPHNMGQKFECTQLENKTQGQQVMATESCHHLAVRSYEENCAMYLMCLEDQWWYHYCPLGMYFNGSLNYCIPDTENVCPQAIKKKDGLEIEDFVVDPCPQEGMLRPSALACNRFYICIAGRWQQQQCTQAGQYYDAEASKCARDTEGICTQLQMDCVPQERRSFPLNCSAYEECSPTGKWEKRICGRDEMYDDLLGGCIRNDGICSARGLKRVCNGQELRWVPGNCSLFYYCLRDSWALGSCVRGHMFSPKEGKCVPYSLLDKCKPLGELGVQQLTEQVHLAEQTQVCENQPEGASVIHPGDCSRYYICVTPSKPYEMQCVMGSFFDPQLGYCRPNDGSCRLPLTGECANATDGSLVAHPTNCQAYYSCSTLTGQQLLYCPEGQYYHKFTRQCRADHGECKGAVTNENSKCANASHGTRLAHERYCNIYYACVRGLAIPIECPEQYQFNALLGKCLYDATGQCQDGHLVDTNQTTYSCGTLPDGSYLPDRKDCTRYYICSEGQAQPKKCSGSTYFDSQQLLCVPDDGSCPFVDEDAPNQHPVPPDPIVCEGKHGYIMADPLNCNNFYVCLDGKLRHERCYDQHFFNATSNQCQKKPLESALDEEAVTEPLAGNLLKSQPLRQQQQCTDNSTSVEQMCKEYSDGTTIAQQGDCRYFITCQPEDEEPLLQKCRNGESYDSLLGFCRQNDGTCLLENGKRVGECNDRHGQLTRDPNNCRQYFTCINGQKIPQTCGEHEYFSKSLNACVNDTANTCNPEQQQQQQIAEEPQKQTMQQSCVGLSEGMLYPYVADNCRSYFQCVKGVAEIHQCADGLYFDVAAIKCVKEIEECSMAPKSMQRTLQLKQKTYDQLCVNRKPDTTYAHTENKCKSYYTCGSRGEITHALCPLGMAFDGRAQRCLPENQVICM